MNDPSQPSAPPPETFVDLLREYIDFVNMQVGAWMDALAGFAGHVTRIERQVHRVQRPSHRRTSEKGEPVIVWTSYEDPSKPAVIHNRILRADDYIAANAQGGSNEQQHARAILVFLYTAWESEFRPRLAQARGVAVNDIRSDIMGDLRELRHCIIHGRSILSAEKHRKLRRLGAMFRPDAPLFIGYDDMHTIFVLIKQDCARMMFEWLGVTNPEGLASDIQGIAIQRGPRSPSAT